MLPDSLTAIFRRDLGAARRQLEAYPGEEEIWRAVPGLPNSGGVLARHLAGNLQHFIGTLLGGSSYRRDRAAEFGAPPWPRDRLLAELVTTESTILPVLAGLSPERLAEGYPEPVGGQLLGTGDFLLHLAVHLGFHLGQLDYHRRAVTGDPRGIAPMALAGLASARPAAG